MFTGIIEETGSIREINRLERTLELKIEAAHVMKEIQLGDSIAINGTCLTVTDFTDWSFSGDALPETFQSTSLWKVADLSLVNWERAMSAEGRFGCHFVTGHVDGTGRSIQTTIDENAYLLEISVPEQ